MTTACRVLLVGRGLSKGHGARALGSALFHAGVIEAGPPVDFAAMPDAVTRHAPQVVVLSLDGARDDAIAAIEAVMAERPVPILVIASREGTRQEAIRALAAGALEIADLKDGPAPYEGLHRQVVFLSKVKVVKHLKGRQRAKKADGAPRQRHPIVAIAASLGGPQALARLLSALPRPFACPVVLCQHITAGFADDLARYLKVETRHQVTQAVEGEALSAGRVYVAPSGAHLIVSAQSTVQLDFGAAVGGFKPSCDVLLKSAAAAFGERAIGVVLTGMGNDGARGLKEIRARGGHTIAQDQQSSVVFGMPGEAIALGAAEKVLPLSAIAAQLAQWVASR